MNYKKLLPFLLLFYSLILGTQSVYATHIMGGEIVWDCQPNGQYIFTLKVYRDCNGVAFNVNNHALQVHNYPAPGGISQIPLTFSSVIDITPACEGSPCATLNQSDPDIPGAIEEYVLVSNPVTLNGVPGPNGWIFTWTYGDRNAAIDNIVNAQNFGMTLRAKMYAYNGQNVGNCFDSSPDFFQKPSTIICAGGQFTYNHSAFDNELDSLAYSWARPLDGNFCNPPPCTIGGLYVENNNPAILPLDGASGFSYLSPFPDTNLDSRNVPAVLDAETGEITFTSYNQGEYVSVIKVEAWRCGQLIAEVYRELQTVITSGCSANLPPEIPSPFANNTFRDTVKVGDFINFDLSIYDTLRSGNPKDDSLFIFASGQQFGTGQTDSTMGCDNPPCATLSSITPDTGVGIYTTNFRWQTTCTHIANFTPVCNSALNTYLFSVRAFDDYCPAAGQTIASVFITILAEEQVRPPDIHCADVQANGDVIVDWNQTPDPDGSFNAWMVYSSTNRNGPYVLIDSIFDYNQTTYTHNGAGADAQSIHYIIRARSGCNAGWTILPTDTISTIFNTPSFNNDCVELNWNPLDTPWPAGSDVAYNIYREYPIGSGFVLQGTSATENFCDTFAICTDTVAYRIELVNSGNGCAGSNSNVAGIRFKYPDPVINAGNDQDICDGQSAILGASPTATGDVDYLWTPDTDMDDDTLANPTVNPNDTIKYYLLVTDQRGCTSTDSIVINTQETPEAIAGVDSNVCSAAFPFQLYGNVSISNSGRWIGGNGTFNPDRNDLNATYDPSPAEISAGFVDLQLVSDNIGICDPDTDQVRINIVSYTANNNVTTTNVSCNGGSDGSINLNPSGGVGPFVFNWSDGPTTANRSNLSANTYDVTITNSFGCDSVLSITITEPAALTSNISSTSNISCNGLSDGSITISANNGTAPYTYLWNDPANSTTATVNNLSAGTYTVTITDNNSCSITNTATLSEPNILQATASLQNNVSCFGGNDGQALGSAIGGTAPYTFNWNDPANTNAAAVNNLAIGTYVLTVTDQNACTDTASIFISEPTQLTANISASSDANCNGASDGTATVSAGGGTAPYTYLWNDAANTSSASVSGLPAGTYTVTVSDNLACSITASVVINQPAALSGASSTSNDVSCFGFSDGEAFVTAFGGTSPYTFVWNDPANTQNDTLSGVAAGTYTVTITDDNGCSITSSQTISEPTLLTASIANSSNISCFGGTDGGISVTANGGTSPYTYLWSDPSATTIDTVSNLSAGSYTVTVSDNNACTALASITLSEPTLLQASTSVQNNVSCFGGTDGQALGSATGGTAPYTYLWNDPANTNNATVNNLSAGSYLLTVTDQNGCTDTASVIITEPTQLGSSISSSNDANCNGSADGTATVSANGGTTPYTYLWNDPANTTTPTVNGLAAGTYTVTVTDNEGCTVSSSVIINEPASLLAVPASSTDVSCFGLSDGEAIAAASGGTTPYTFNWNDPANTQNDTLSGIPAGTYTVTVTDANNCTSSTSVNISEPPLLQTSISDTTMVSCFSLADGGTKVSASGGTLPYTYLWNDPTNATTDSVGNLLAGVYTVTVSDDQGCTAIDSIEITQADSLISNISNSIDVSCFGAADGSASVSVIGGTQPYTYLWNDPANTSNDTVSNLSGGTYTVTVSDANGCSDTSSVFIVEPNPLIVGAGLIDSVSCFGLSDGTVAAAGAGGTAPYSFVWSDQAATASDTLRGISVGKYYVTLTDQNACQAIDSVEMLEPDSLMIDLLSSGNVSCFNGNDGFINTTRTGGSTPYTYLWSNNSTAADLNNLTAGRYTVTITDANNCSDTTIVDISQPQLLVSTLDTSINVSCNGLSDGSANVSVNGGTTPYTYLWNDNASTSTANVSNLAVGTYTLTVTDANQCTSTTTVQITEPATLLSTINNQLNVSCFGFSDGSITASANGGTSPYTYFWSNNADSSFIDNLVAGNYLLTITDANGCSVVDSARITQPSGMSINLDSDSISCFGFNDGRISSSVFGGTTPYTYNWSNNRTSPNLNNLGAGVYTLVVTDDQACTVSDSAEIIEPDPITLDLTDSDTICINSNKLLVASANGGTGAYQYNWSNNLGNSSTVSITPTSSGTYTVSVTDANNCPTVSESVEVGVRDIFSETLELRSSGNICVDSTATLTPIFSPSSGAIGPFTFSWNQNLSGRDPVMVSPPVTTEYILEIVDACNNSISDTALVEVSDPPAINLPDSLIEGCQPLKVSFTNNTSPTFIYNWDFGDGNSSTLFSPTHTYLEPGAYQVDLRVSTPQGCVSEFNGDFRVIVRPKPLSEIELAEEVVDIEEPVVEAFAEIADASNFYWTFGDGDSAFIQNPTHTYEDTGTYEIGLYKENVFGCLDTAYRFFRVNPNFNIQIPNVFIPNPGGSNGGTYDPNNPNNAVFFPFVEYVDDYKLTIFNRWGELIFESEDQNIGWDGYYKGELCQSDVYVYKLELRFIDGQTTTKIGDLTLLR